MKQGTFDKYHRAETSINIFVKLTHTLKDVCKKEIVKALHNSSSSVPY